MMGHEHQDWVQRARAVPIEKEIERRGYKLRREGPERIGACPRCGGDDRFAINTKKQVFNCRGCGIGGDVIHLVEHLDGVDFNTACTTLAGPPPKKANGKANGKDTSRKVVAATFEYQNADGSIAFAVERIEFQKPHGIYVLKDGKHDKVFRQRQPDPDYPDRWLPNVTGAPVVPYKLPRVLEAVAAGHPILIVEGEAKADLLWSWNVAATCCAGGAKKWKSEHSAFLKDADVVLVPDNDGAGFKHIDDVGASLSGVAKTIRVLLLPDLPIKGDVIDWAKAGGTREKFAELVAEKAQDWQPLSSEEKGNLDAAVKAEAKEREDDLIAALEKMKPGIEYHRQRKQAAKDLDVNVSDIDAELERRRDAVPLRGHWVVEPWPDPVDGDSLLRDIIKRIRRHVTCSYDDALVIALWIVFSWVHDDVAVHSPILLVTSAEPESGKTTTLNLISYLIVRGFSNVDISKAALFRSIKLWNPSFIIDEFDTVLASTDDDKAELRSVINSGHTKGQTITRCVTDEHRPEEFPTFSPKVLGMIGKRMPPSTLGRCIVIELRRRLRGDIIDRFEHKDDAELADLRRRLRRWAMDNTEALITAHRADVSMPSSFTNRRADNWRLLFAVADLCTGIEEYGDKARAAAVAIENKAESQTTSERALTDAKAIFYRTNDDGQPTEILERISSAELVAQLATYPDSPWAEYRGGKPITQLQLARLLKPHGIAPQVIRMPSGGTMRGYLRAQFEDAWDRHV